MTKWQMTKWQMTKWQMTRAKKTFDTVHDMDVI